MGLQSQARSMALIRDALDLLDDIGIKDIRMARMHSLIPPYL